MKLDELSVTGRPAHPARRGSSKWSAGVDPSKIVGWIFTRIPVKHKSGKTVDVDKFVKPYNLS